MISKQIPLSMLIFGQKSCFLGPTIFKIPQPNWHYCVCLGAQFYIQLVFKAPLCITLTISDQKIVSGSLFFQFLRAKIENLEKDYKRVIM